MSFGCWQYPRHFDWRILLLWPLRQQFVIQVFAPQSDPDGFVQSLFNHHNIFLADGGRLFPGELMPLIVERKSKVV